MNRRMTLALLVLLLLFLSTSSASQVAVEAQGSEVTVSSITMPGPWEAENPSAFSIFKRFGWGTEVMVNAAGQQWVHISMPVQFFNDNIFWSVSAIRFCAKSSNPVGTKPIRVDIWAYDTRISTQNITWVANTGIQCYGPDYSPAKLLTDVTISVLLKFGNINHKITLFRSEVTTKY